MTQDSMVSDASQNDRAEKPAAKKEREISTYEDQWVPNRISNPRDAIAATKIGREISDLTLADSEFDDHQGANGVRNKFRSVKYRPAGRRGICLMDCCGIFTAMIAWAIVLSSFHVLATVVLPYTDTIIGVFTFLILLFFAVMSLWSHAACMTADPGIVPLCHEVGES